MTASKTSRHPQPHGMSGGGPIGSHVAEVGTLMPCIMTYMGVLVNG